MPPISVLDLSPVAAGSHRGEALRDTIELARDAERLGYTRYWLAEHHGGAMVASSSPELMIGAVAAATERIRVGSGGVMLPNHSALHVAEQFKVLAALHPGPDRPRDRPRARNRPDDRARAAAQPRGDGRRGLPQPARRAARLLGREGRGPQGHPFTPRARGARRRRRCRRSTCSARASTRPSSPPRPASAFAFAAHINPEMAVDALRLYRERFEPSRAGSPSRTRSSPTRSSAPTTTSAPGELAAPARVAFRRLRAGRPTPLPSVEDALAEEGPRPPRRPGQAERMLVGSPEHGPRPGRRAAQRAAAPTS